MPETFYSIDLTSAAVVQIQPGGNGDSGESIAFRPADGLMYHWSGRSPTEIIRDHGDDRPEQHRVDQHSRELHQLDPFEVLGSTYDASNDQFLVTDLNGQLSSVSITGDWDTIATLPLGGERAIAFNGGALYIGDRFGDTLSDTDPNTGATNSTVAVTLGGFNVGGILSLTTDPASGTLYAILRDALSGDRRLVTLDSLSGVATDIGPLPDGFANIEFADAGCPVSATQPVLTRAFVINGTSTGVGGSWSATWGTAGSIGIPTPIQVPPVTAGSSADVIAASWIASVIPSPLPAPNCAIGSSSSNLFALAVQNAPAPFTLCVGAFGATGPLTNCLPPNASLSFNPTVDPIETEQTLSGTAVGGSITAFLQSQQTTIATTSGETESDAAATLALAINSQTSFSAIAIAGSVFVAGIDQQDFSLAIDDPGFGNLIAVPAIGSWGLVGLIAMCLATSVATMLVYRTEAKSKGKA